MRIDYQKILSHIGELIMAYDLKEPDIRFCLFPERVDFYVSLEDFKRIYTGKEVRKIIEPWQTRFEYQPVEGLHVYTHILDQNMKTKVETITLGEE